MQQAGNADIDVGNAHVHQELHFTPLGEYLLGVLGQSGRIGTW